MDMDLSCALSRSLDSRMISLSGALLMTASYAACCAEASSSLAFLNCSKRSSGMVLIPFLYESNDYASP